MKNFRNRLLKGTVGGSDQSSWRGVFIEDTTGKLWTIDSWDWSATFNSVAVISDTHSFGIAGEHTEECSFSPIVGHDNFCNTITAYSYNRPSFPTVEESYLDFDGENNTSLILAEQGAGTEYAAQKCNAYTFPNGKKGYLMSAGEFHIIDENWTEINLTLKHLSLQELELGGTNIDLIGTWTSTYCGEDFNAQFNQGSYVAITGGTYAYGVQEFKRVVFSSSGGTSLLNGGISLFDVKFPERGGYRGESPLGHSISLTVSSNIGCRPLCRLMNF